MAGRGRITVLLIFLVAAFAMAIWFSPRRAPTPVANSLAEIRTHRWNNDEQEKAAAALARLGDEAIPSIAAALQEKDSAFAQKYDVWRARVPADIRHHFPERPSKDDLRRAIATSIYDIGPAASRALVGAIEYAIEPSMGLMNMEVLRTLYWSIPESPKAVQILSNYVAHPAPELPLFGMKDSDEIWPHVPHLAPLLAKWLIYADTAREAAEGLSHMGTNAHFAIPQIIELAGNGYVGPPSNATLHVSYTPNLETNVLNHNKSGALKALGRLGVASPEVLAIVTKQLTNEAPFLRVAAANAFGDLGPNAAPLLPTLLTNLDQSHRMVLRYQLEAVGKMGSAAKSALPTLLRFADESIATHVPDGEPFGFGIRWGWEPLDLPFVAAVAIAKIDLTAAKPVAAQIAGAFNSGIKTNEIVTVRPLLAEIRPHLESARTNPRLFDYHTLVLDPTNEAAKKSLLALMQPENHINIRSVAALWYFNVFRDTNLALQVFRETLPQVRDLQTQTPVTLAGQLGPAGRPLAPFLKPILTNEHRIMRNLAGKALRAIAPDEMPRIVEE
jgi:HEAT repeat protein